MASSLCRRANSGCRGCSTGSHRQGLPSLLVGREWPSRHCCTSELSHHRRVNVGHAVLLSAIIKAFAGVENPGSTIYACCSTIFACCCQRNARRPALEYMSLPHLIACYFIRYHPHQCSFAGSSQLPNPLQLLLKGCYIIYLLLSAFY